MKCNAPLVHSATVVSWRFVEKCSAAENTKCASFTLKVSKDSCVSTSRCLVQCIHYGLAGWRQVFRVLLMAERQTVHCVGHRGLSDGDSFSTLGWNVISCTSWKMNSCSSAAVHVFVTFEYTDSDCSDNGQLLSSLEPVHNFVCHSYLLHYCMPVQCSWQVGGNTWPAHLSWHWTISVLCCLKLH